MTLSFVDSVCKVDLNEIFPEFLLSANASFQPCTTLLEVGPSMNSNNKHTDNTDKQITFSKCSIHYRAYVAHTLSDPSSSSWESELLFGGGGGTRGHSIRL